ncbi:MAG: gamma-glutamyl-gamma-aminobutyrate hydrolase family protein [Ktedonobacterales bacterium]
MHPIIGIPCYAAERAGTQRPLYGNNQSYIQAVLRAGGAPLLIPPAPAEVLADIASRLDGVLLSGGGDLDPRMYGEQVLPECDPPEVERDELEDFYTRWALQARKPVLGICRGLQILNVVRGGSLYQDIPSQCDRPLRHNCAGEERNYIAHTIQIDPDSQFGAIIGAPTVGVNSFHHQALNALGAGLRVVATAEDGIIEAAEMPEFPFVVAVQYHPEAMDDDNAASQRLFAGFVAACAHTA